MTLKHEKQVRTATLHFKNTKLVFASVKVKIRPTAMNEVCNSSSPFQIFLVAS